jgi:hypothetical protein
MRRSIFGLEAIALLDLRPSRVEVEGSEGMVFLELVLEEQSLDPDEEPVEGERWALVGGEWFLDDLGARCRGAPSDP